MDKKRYILMLEDESADLALAERELRKAGIDFSSRRVDTREAFIACLEQHCPDMILADYKLPAFDGLDVTYKSGSGQSHEARSAPLARLRGGSGWTRRPSCNRPAIPQFDNAKLKRLPVRYIH